MFSYKKKYNIKPYDKFPSTCKTISLHITTLTSILFILILFVTITWVFSAFLYTEVTLYTHTYIHHIFHHNAFHNQDTDTDARTEGRLTCQNHCTKTQ